jgi:hypothetical protein
MPKILAGSALHSGDTPDQRALRSDQRLLNLQSADLLIDPQDRTSGYTHSTNDLKYKGPKRVAANSLVVDEEMDGPLRTHGDLNPGENYLDTEDGMPVIDVPTLAGADEDEFDEFSDDIATDTDVLDTGDEFEALTAEELPELEDSDDDAELEANDDAADFEDTSLEETLALVDVDEVPDDVDGEELNFACSANALHVIRSNRIIASMGPAAARKANASDIYQQQVFHDAIVANVEQSGLRKGLLQAGLQLSRVKLKAAKVTAKLVASKVQAATAKHLTASKQQQAALEQSLAIAAVGINTNYFKGVQNPLKAALVNELSHAGFRNADRLVTSIFAKHGVDYSRSMVTLAQRLAAMSEEARDGYVSALDMVSEEVELDDGLTDVDAEFDENEDELVPLSATTSVTAALTNPARRAVLLQSKTQDGSPASVARAILAGSQSLI